LANTSPSGENRIEFADPETCSAVIVTGDFSAPLGTTSVDFPTVSEPPSRPMVADAMAYGNDWQLRRSTEVEVTPPSTLVTVEERSAPCGAPLDGSTGLCSLELQAAPTRSAPMAITPRNLRFQETILPTPGCGEGRATIPRSGRPTAGVCPGPRP
jgi:hypothetical protein